MGSTRRWRRAKPRRRSPYRLLDVLGAVAHLEFAQIPLQFPQNIVPTEVFVVDLRGGAASMRDEVRVVSEVVRE